MDNFYYNFSRDNFYDVSNSFYNVSYELSSYQPGSYEYLLLHNMNHIKTRPEDIEKDDKVRLKGANNYKNCNQQEDEYNDNEYNNSKYEE